jgi:hypothetical protein
VLSAELGDDDDDGDNKKKGKHKKKKEIAIPRKHRMAQVCITLLCVRCAVLCGVSCIPLTVEGYGALRRVGSLRSALLVALNTSLLFTPSWQAIRLPLSMFTAPCDA